MPQTALAPSSCPMCLRGPCRCSITNHGLTLRRALALHSLNEGKVGSHISCI